ncbi:MAG: hypothetical protein LBL71_00250 [Endomicrobium sp.]|jgi:transcriptional regulator NrdR family protein|nr:hypothetical protein [Endomicrobium sp.]
MDRACKKRAISFETINEIAGEIGSDTMTKYTRGVLSSMIDGKVLDKIRNGEFYVA